MRYRFLSFEKSYGDRQFIVRFKQYKKKKKKTICTITVHDERIILS